MRAGRGIIHAEGMNENRKAAERIHGLQIWISLPAKDKFIEPDFFHYPASTLPVISHQANTITILCGALLGHESPVVSLSPAYIYIVQMPPGAQLELPIATGNTCGIYVVEGEIACDDKTLGSQTMVRMDELGDTLSVASPSGARIAILGGEPLREPIVAYASFVMNSPEQINQVIADYNAGKMGELKVS
jgi:quercetin 2,3-dioxygenase